MDIDQTEPPSKEILFDEEWYLRQNPAIAAAVRDGGFESGWQHYVLHGRSEGRLPAPPANNGSEPPFADHNGKNFLTPRSFVITNLKLTRIAIIGSCQIGSLGLHKPQLADWQADLITVNGLAELPHIPNEQITSYDLAVVQVPLRSVLSDDALWHMNYADSDAYEAAFQRACGILEYNLQVWMKWNREFSLLTFVTNFLVPQQNPMGRLFPRYDIRNPEYFVDRLNEHLEKVVRSKKNAYVLDLDRIAASIGRRYVQDDFYTVISHGAFLPYAPPDNTRIEPMADFSVHHDIRWDKELPEMVVAEITAMCRTIRQIDPVKVVIVDLDDTLWKGVSGDLNDVDGMMVEGWHIGIAEALIYLKKRGVLLAIASKNEESRIREIWPRIFGQRLRLEDFAAVKINWSPKPENVRAILEGMNLLSRNAVFIDDNPAEREAMSRAFPDMRVIGRYPYYLKRILLWSPETQVTSVTDESSRRTEMIQAQFTRENFRKEMSRDDFLREASPRVTMLYIDGIQHPRFARVFELLNKTNQFNTTGRRWKAEECESFFADRGKMVAFEVADRFTSYGLVGVIMLRDRHIEQWVMSCRVLGYQIEDAVMATIVNDMRATERGLVTARLVLTDVNFPCRDLFPKCGFADQDGTGDWVLSDHTTLFIPDHVRIE